VKKERLNYLLEPPVGGAAVYGMLLNIKAPPIPPLWGVQIFTNKQVAHSREDRMASRKSNFRTKARNDSPAQVVELTEIFRWARQYRAGEIRAMMPYSLVALEIGLF
jgi:hypothetical protein